MLGLLIASPTHTLTGRGGGQGQVPLHSHSLSNIKSEDIEIQLSRREFMGPVLMCVHLRVMPLLRESQLKGVKKGRDHF